MWQTKGDFARTICSDSSWVLLSSERRMVFPLRMGGHLSNEGFMTCFREEGQGGGQLDLPAFSVFLVTFSL